jgi:hypothetical protein
MPHLYMHTAELGEDVMTGRTYFCQHSVRRKPDLSNSADVSPALTTLCAYRTDY